MASLNPDGRLVTPKFKQGDEVWTNWYGRTTFHTIQRISTKKVCYSGVMYKVLPNITNDWGDWFDEAWFHKVEVREQGGAK